jgi:FlaA1/EpsC-like NDP-sugar epimerase
MAEQVRNLPRWLLRFRAPLSVLVNMGVIATAYVAAFLLRFDLSPPPSEQRHMLITLPAAVVIQYAAFWLFKLTRGWWRYVGIVDFVNAIKAAITGTAGLALYVLMFAREHYPRSVFLLFAILVVGLSIGVRLAVRMWRELPSAPDLDGPKRRLLIIGAGDTGEALLREIRQSGRLNYKVVAFLDDNRAKRGAYINGVPVVDEIAEAPSVVKRFEIEEIVVATPSATGDQLRVIVGHCRDAGVPFRVLPATWEVLRGRVTLGEAREVDINDLLRRQPVALDLAGIERLLKGRRILVTGAAGSIGSEICRQVLRYEAAALHCLDHDENALFFLERDLRAGAAAAASALRCHLADITDPIRIDAIFGAARPEIIFHAAAHKHVPIIEANALEGLRNNVFGTEVIADAAGRFDAETFVMISTDKAVNPTSVMGVSKQIAEKLIRTKRYKTRFTAVRFGNVLGSQGSVVPILKEQIARGGPVTVTHPDMRRYFMTIPEAVELVIQAGAIGGGGEVFILDMGEPVRIVDLANDLITLSGLRPGVDIEIVFSGLRPGEKLYEELHLDSETCDRTTHPQILVAKQVPVDLGRFNKLVGDLRMAVGRSDDLAARHLLPQLVPEYRVPGGNENVIPISAAKRT